MNKILIIVFSILFLALAGFTGYTYYSLTQATNKVSQLEQELATSKNKIQALEEQTGTSTDTDTNTTTDTSTDQNTQKPLKVKLYYKNYKKDPDVLTCLADTYVEREIPYTKTPLTDTIRLLLTNELTASEKNLGLKTEFNNLTLSPNSKNFKLVSIIMNGNTATLEFADPDNFSSGGSCRAGLLWSQVQKTAMQFSNVKEVKFTPESVFQP